MSKHIIISRKFAEKLSALSRPIQKGVNGIYSKLVKNADGAGLNLEPIQGAASPSMKSVRVNGNYRIVLHQDSKGTFTFLHIDTHDAAYAWARRNKFEVNPYTGEVQLYVVDIPEVRVDGETPATHGEQEGAATAAAPGPFANMPSDEDLKRLGVPESQIPLVRSLKDDEDILAHEEDFSQGVFDALLLAFDGKNADEIIKELGIASKGANIDDVAKAVESSDASQANFAFASSEEELNEIRKAALAKWRIFLHPSQRKLVDAEYKGTMKVSGGAGTGKTIAAIHRLKYLCQNPNAKVLFTTYTRTLCVNLADSIAKLDVPSQKYTLSNIDRVLLDVAQTYKVKEGYKVLDYSGDEESLKLWREVLESEVTEFDEQFLYDEYIDVIVYFGNKDVKQYMMQPRVGRTKALSRKQRIDIWKLVEKYNALKQERKVVDRLELFNETTNFLNENNIHPYTNVIADEFQDFSNPELKFLRALVAEGRNDLFLVGDPIQRIYTGRKMNFGAAGINVRGVRSRKLKINYRTTEPIRRVAVGVIKGIDYDDMDGGKESTKGYVSLIHNGVVPQYKLVDDANTEVEQVVEWLKDCLDNDIKLSEICIAAPSMQLLKGLQTRLHHDGTEYRVLKGAQKQGSTKGVDLCTFHSLKGLEYRVIILMGVNERNVPSKVKEGYPFSGMDKVAQK